MWQVKRHLGKTPYQCGECHRYYGDSQSLKIHMKKHAPAGEEEQQFTCGVCNKSFITAETQKQQRFRHDSSLKDADFVLVFCGGNHYVPAGEEWSRAEISPGGSGHWSLLELRSVLTALLCHFFLISRFRVLYWASLGTERCSVEISP